MLMEHINMGRIWNSNCVIHCRIKDEAGHTLWHLFACYGTPYLREKIAFWEMLE